MYVRTFALVVDVLCLSVGQFELQFGGMILLHAVDDQGDVEDGLDAEQDHDQKNRNAKQPENDWRRREKKG